MVEASGELAARKVRVWNELRLVVCYEVMGPDESWSGRERRFRAACGRFRRRASTSGVFTENEKRTASRVAERRLDVHASRAARQLSG